MPARRPGAGLTRSSLIVAVVAVGVVVAALHHPQIGMYVAAGGLAAGAALRLVLRQRDAGLLVVRRRRVDVVVLAGLALALGVLRGGHAVPARPGLSAPGHD